MSDHYDRYNGMGKLLSTNLAEVGTDCISRQAAIDTVMGFMPSLTTPDGCGQFDREIFKAQEMFVDIGQALNKLPSVQPEIIRCNSCKYWTQTTGKMKSYGLGRCDFHDADLVACNGFCYWAERRNNE